MSAELAKYAATLVLDDASGRLNRNFSDIERLSSSLSTIPLLSGRLIEDVTLAGPGNDIYVEHGLGRPIRGWIIVDKNITGGAVARSTTSTDNSKFLILKGASQVISLWVF